VTLDPFIEMHEAISINARGDIGASRQQRPTSNGSSVTLGRAAHGPEAARLRALAGPLYGALFRAGTITPAQRELCEMIVKGSFALGRVDARFVRLNDVMALTRPGQDVAPLLNGYTKVTASRLPDGEPEKVRTMGLIELGMVRRVALADVPGGPRWCLALVPVWSSWKCGWSHSAGEMARWQGERLALAESCLAQPVAQEIAERWSLDALLQEGEIEAAERLVNEERQPARAPVHQRDAGPNGGANARQRDQTVSGLDRGPNARPMASERPVGGSGQRDVASRDDARQTVSALNGSAQPVVDDIAIRVRFSKIAALASQRVAGPNDAARNDVVHPGGVQQRDCARRTGQQPNDGMQRHGAGGTCHQADARPCRPVGGGRADAVGGSEIPKRVFSGNGAGPEFPKARASETVKQELKQKTVQPLNCSVGGDGELRRQNRLLADLTVEFERAHGTDWAAAEMANSGVHWRMVARDWPELLDSETANLRDHINEGRKFTRNAQAFVTYYMLKRLGAATWPAARLKISRNLFKNQ